MFSPVYLAIASLPAGFLLGKWKGIHIIFAVPLAFTALSLAPVAWQAFPVYKAQLEVERELRSMARDGMGPHRKREFEQFVEANELRFDPKWVKFHRRSIEVDYDVVIPMAFEGISVALSFQRSITEPGK